METMFPVTLDDQRSTVVRDVTGPAALADLMHLTAEVDSLRRQLHHLETALQGAGALLTFAAQPRALRGDDDPQQ